MNVFEQNLDLFYREFGKSKLMVLSTSENDKVTSRMMSIIQIDGLFYFQTDKNFRKYCQLIHNPQVALCIDNIQIEGICEEIGCPRDFQDFCAIYKECFPSSYSRYTFLENEKLFRIEPIFVERWKYINGNPYMEIFDMKEKVYTLKVYNEK